MAVSQIVNSGGLEYKNRIELNDYLMTKYDNSVGSQQLNHLLWKMTNCWKDTGNYQIRIVKNY